MPVLQLGYRYLCLWVEVELEEKSTFHLIFTLPVILAFGGCATWETAGDGPRSFIFASQAGNSP